MNTFKKVVLSGTPHERGVTYGWECRELIDRTIGDYERYFNNKPNLSWDYAIQMAVKFIPRHRGVRAGTDGGDARHSGRLRPFI